jgi:hypothetical protein
MTGFSPCLPYPYDHLPVANFFAACKATEYSHPLEIRGYAHLNFSFYSPIVVDMRALPFPKSCVVCCKKCGHDVLTGADSFPACPVYVVCSLCGEKRKYLPSEVIHGRPHFLLRKRASRRQAPLIISARARA